MFVVFKLMNSKSDDDPDIFKKPFGGDFFSKQNEALDKAEYYLETFSFIPIPKPARPSKVSSKLSKNCYKTSTKKSTKQNSKNQSKNSTKTSNKKSAKSAAKKPSPKPRKIKFQRAGLITISAIKMLQAVLKFDYKVPTLKTWHCSQDLLELKFSDIRAMDGQNRTPSPLQYLYRQSRDITKHFLKDCFICFQPRISGNVVTLFDRKEL